MWWKRQSKAEPPLSDGELNAALDSHTNHLIETLSDEPPEFFPMVIEVRHDNKSITTLVSEDGEETDDYDRLFQDFAKSLKRNSSMPQALIVAFAAESEDGREFVNSHCAAPARRQSFSIVDLQRNQSGGLAFIGRRVLYYPADPVEMPRFNSAGTILSHMH